MEIYKKLQQARDLIRQSKIKKAGWNDYSKYFYFTPEQISNLVHEAENETGLIHTFIMERDQNGIHGILNIIDIETDEVIKFIQATEIPEIKATNAAQQIGGAVTYTLRYMLMTAFNIADNSLDFDSQDNRPKEDAIKPTANVQLPETAKLPIPEKAFGQLCDKLKSNPDKKDRGALLTKVRNTYKPLTNEQESIISEIIDNK